MENIEVPSYDLNHNTYNNQYDLIDLILKKPIITEDDELKKKILFAYTVKKVQFVQFNSL